MVPISAQFKCNIDTVNKYIDKRILIPIRDLTAYLRLIVIRSFDVKPGAEADSLTRGIGGCSILSGASKLRDKIEIRPGIVTKDNEGKIK
ncbi:hypothetical protein BGZ80_002776 [Entomortierella chlamydospora]|uniref:Uncharacterized protein n=1 Tax=Entomortierella chlamydospora TaxID=101097 RepID=A0A9P6T4Q7_9FUNG|nr:hypothetical protein BGZ79_009572 [Entomortierella chlamydospora]KAG0024461.1 hypothetical protein BGZ80_002776 [Entomortierella chlamydospora]